MIFKNLDPLKKNLDSDPLFDLVFVILVMKKEVQSEKLCLVDNRLYNVWYRYFLQKNMIFRFGPFSQGIWNRSRIRITKNSLDLQL